MDQLTKLSTKWHAVNCFLQHTAVGRNHSGRKQKDTLTQVFGSVVVKDLRSLLGRFLEFSYETEAKLNVRTSQQSGSDVNYVVWYAIRYEFNELMGPVRIRHRSYHFATQSSHSVDPAGWQAKMASIEIWIPWRNVHKPHSQIFGHNLGKFPH